MIVTSIRDRHGERRTIASSLPEPDPLVCLRIPRAARRERMPGKRRPE
jgi:hypothetical protein